MCAGSRGRNQEQARLRRAQGCFLQSTRIARLIEIALSSGSLL